MRGLDASTYEAWLASWSTAWDLPELPYRVRIVFSHRLQSSLGRCAPSEGLVRLNPGLLDGAPEALREVVCHEVAHVATWLLYGRRARARPPANTRGRAVGGIGGPGRAGRTTLCLVLVVTGSRHDAR